MSPQSLVLTDPCRPELSFRAIVRSKKPKKGAGAVSLQPKPLPCD